jgi:hypothetical protein
MAVWCVAAVIDWTPSQRAMFCYDGTVRNSLGDLIQIFYGEDGADGAFIEQQNIDTFSLKIKHN